MAKLTALTLTAMNLAASSLPLGAAPVGPSEWARFDQKAYAATAEASRALHRLRVEQKPIVAPSPLFQDYIEGVYKKCEHEWVALSRRLVPAYGPPAASG